MNDRADPLALVPTPAGRRAPGRSGASRPEPLGGGERSEPGRHDVRGGVVAGDCLDVLRSLPAERVDLIVTSPPYADQRASTYGGVTADDYVAWFLPRAEQFLRVLKPRGSLVINIKEKVVDGERHTYVLELILALKKQGWLWTEEYVWHKRNCFPGKWPNRFRDAWERCLHFTREKRFKMNQDAVMVPMGDWASTRLKTLGANDVRRHDSQVGNAFGKNIANWQGRDRAYPTNVLHLATECGNKGHSAAFPQALPRWFIELFTDPGDTVLDPFAGSGTTLAAALALGRNAIGVELAPAYAARCRETLASAHEAAQALARAATVTEQDFVSIARDPSIAGKASKDSVPS
jgi:DNA modification methylase